MGSRWTCRGVCGEEGACTLVATREVSLERVPAQNPFQTPRRGRGSFGAVGSVAVRTTDEEDRTIELNRETAR